MNNPRLSLVADPPGVGDDVLHMVCCDDPVGDVAQCGTDVSADLWAEAETSCVVCAALEAAGYCRRWGTCPRQQGTCS